ncbi:MAG: nucleoside monophosphate kinase [archaeon]
MIVGLVGGMGSGKGTVANILVKEYGFIKLVFSDVLREELEKDGKEFTRQNLQDLGDELREKHGRGALAKVLLNKVKPGQNYVIDGFRNPGEVLEFRKRDEFFFIGVDSTMENRFKRVNTRTEKDSVSTFEEFVKFDQRDFGKGEKESGLRIADCYSMKDKEISNDGSMEELRIRIEKLLKEIKGEN